LTEKTKMILYRKNNISQQKVYQDCALIGAAPTTTTLETETSAKNAG
jgi:hypothetical protein